MDRRELLKMIVAATGAATACLRSRRETPPRHR